MPADNAAPDPRALIERATSVLPGEVATVEARFLHELADALESALDQVEELKAECDDLRTQLGWDVAASGKILAERDAARARAAKAEAELATVIERWPEYSDDPVYACKHEDKWWHKGSLAGVFATKAGAIRAYCNLPPEGGGA